MIRDDQNEFICIECCHKLKSIFKIYQDGFKDIIQCPKCKQLVDPYVECEHSVILIDLMLLKKKTYNHILINKSFKNSLLIKFLVTFLLCDAYLLWFHYKKSQYDSIKSNDYQLFYTLEWNFYYMLIKAFISFFIYNFILVLACLFNFILDKKKTGSKKDNITFVKLVLKSIILSSFAKIFVIPLVIWKPIDTYFTLAKLFTYLSNIQALNTVTRMQEAKTVCLIFVAALIAHIYSGFLSSISIDNKLHIY